MREIGYLLGYDLGSSAIKAAVIDPETGRPVASATSPAQSELEIHAPRPGWAEQHPDMWWEHVIDATRMLAGNGNLDLHEIDAIGISYQMHGLVLLDRDLRPLRPSIIWCDSRAVEIGDRAANEIGRFKCLGCLLNYPGNFTASKLAWVKENEPEIYAKTYKAMLPGDWLATALTGEARTTASGLSEGIMWDFKNGCPATLVLDYYGISPHIIPDIVPTFGLQGTLLESVAEKLGLRPGIPVSYRAGDQPNNALSLKVLEPGEIAATAGTSGVVYGVSGRMVCDPESRVNTFIHVNHEPGNPSYGVLLCVNGTGILNSWLRNKLFSDKGTRLSYEEMNRQAMNAPVGCDGLAFLPYGNGAERTLGNRDVGASLHGLNLNVHDRGHVLRAAQEGIVFALNHGVEIMRGMGLATRTVRAGHANMFLSPIFREAFANTVKATVELYNTDGAQGAARGAGIGAGIFDGYDEAFAGLEIIDVVEPDDSLAERYEVAWNRWRDVLERRLNER